MHYDPNFKGLNMLNDNFTVLFFHGDKGLESWIIVTAVFVIF